MYEYKHKHKHKYKYKHKHKYMHKYKHKYKLFTEAFHLVYHTYAAYLFFQGSSSFEREWKISLFSLHF